MVHNPPIAQAAAVTSSGTVAVPATATGTLPQTPAVPGAVGAVPAAGDTMMAQGFNLRMFAQDVGKNLGDIFRVMPDIFRGAREGVQLLQTLSSVFGGLEGLGGLADIGGIL